MGNYLNTLLDRWLLSGVALIAALGLAACGGGGGGSGPAPAAPGGGDQAVQLNAVLSGNQISAASGGPIATAAGGSGSLTLSADRTSIAFTLNAGALATFNSPVITGAHIHAQNPGAENGPIIFDFLPAIVPDPLVISGTLTAANLIAVANVPDFPTAVAALLNGTTYFQVHTAAHPGGELRGQIGPASLTSSLSGAQITVATGGPITTNASGTGTATLSPLQDSVAVRLDLGLAANFNGALNAAHIHAGALGADGPVIFDFALPSPIPANPVIEVVLTAADLQPQGAIASFTAAVDALLSGNTYFQVHTAAHPGGELRGQILPTP